MSQVSVNQLTPYLNDDDILEIMFNGYNELFIERRGQIEQAASPFATPEAFNTHLRKLFENDFDETVPVNKTRLVDGSLATLIRPPVSQNGILLTIRKFVRNPLTIDNLIKLGALSPKIIFFLEACIRARLNILIVGGTSSGKTSLINALSSLILAQERIIAVERTATMRLQHPHTLSLEAGKLSFAELVEDVKHMRPDRFLFGEVSAAEVSAILNALSDGYDGSMCTIHAKSLEDALYRLEIMAKTANPALDLPQIQYQIASAFDVIVMIERLPGTNIRRITNISEVLPFDNDDIELLDIFEFDLRGVDDGVVYGRYQTMGNVPSFINRIINIVDYSEFADANQMHLNEAFFCAGTRNLRTEF